MNNITQVQVFCALHLPRLDLWSWQPKSSSALMQLHKRFCTVNVPCRTPSYLHFTLRVLLKRSFTGKYKRGQNVKFIMSNTSIQSNHGNMISLFSIKSRQSIHAIFTFSWGPTTPFCLFCTRAVQNSKLFNTYLHPPLFVAFDHLVDPIILYMYTTWDHSVECMFLLVTLLTHMFWFSEEPFCRSNVWLELLCSPNAPLYRLNM